jgi:hypothetical protein
MNSPKIIALDIDGVLNSSWLDKIATNQRVLKILAGMPTFKKVLLDLIEIGESIILKKGEEKNSLDAIRHKWDAEYFGLITDRSLLGLINAFKGRDYLLQWMSFIQVRDSVLGSLNLKYGQLWKTKNVKPDKAVLYNLQEFALVKKVKPQDVLLIDDDPEFRLVAQEKFGFTVYHPKLLEEQRTILCPQIAPL